MKYLVQSIYDPNYEYYIEADNYEEAVAIALQEQGFTVLEQSIVEEEE